MMVGLRHAAASRMRLASLPKSLLVAAQDRGHSSYQEHFGGEDPPSVRPLITSLDSPASGGPAEPEPNPLTLEGEVSSSLGGDGSPIGSDDQDQELIQQQQSMPSQPGDEPASLKDPKASGFLTAFQQKLLEDDGELLRERTSYLIQEVQHGNFTDVMWHEAIELLEHWTHFSVKLAHTPESVDQSFVLLDRLVLEQETQKYSDISLHYLHTGVVRAVTKNWQRCVRNFHDHSLEDQALLRYEYTPMEVLARLEDYSDRSPRLQFDTRTLNIILDGAGRCCVPAPNGVQNMISARVATAFAQSLFDRMNADHPQNTTNQQKEGGEEDDDSTDTGTVAPLPLGQHGRQADQLIGPPPSTRPNLITYSSIIHMFAMHGLAPRAEFFLDKLYKKYTRGHNERFKPDVNIFTAVLQAWSNSDDPNAAFRAEGILQRMKELSDCGLDNLKPDPVAYMLVMNCWAIYAKKDQKRAQESMKRALLLFQEAKDKGMLHSQSYNVMLNVFAKAGMPKEAEGLFTLMLKDSENKSEVAKPDTIALNTILGAWAKWGHHGCGDKAMKLFQRYEQLYVDGKVASPPDVISYNNAIHCLAVDKQAEKAEELLVKMRTEKELHGVSIEPDRITWNSSIDAYAKAKNPHRAEALLEEMYQEFIAIEGKKSHMKPDRKTFSSVLNAWRISNEPTAPERAEAILKTMHSLDEAGVLNVQPNSVCYNILIACWMTSRAKDAPFRAQAILDIMEEKFQKGSATVRPDATAYNHVLVAYANRNWAPQAEKILERFHQLSLPAAQGGGGNTREKPSAYSYNRVLGAFSRSSNIKAGQRAEELFKLWQQRFEAGEVSFPPEPLSVTIVLQTWEAAAKRERNPYDQAASRAQKFLRYVRETFPDSPLYSNTEVHNGILRLFGMKNCRDAAAAQKHLWGMAEQGKPHEKPNVESLNLVLSVMKSTPAPIGHIVTLIRKVAESDQFDFQPNLESYRLVLACLEHHRALEAVKTAESLLEEMKHIPDLNINGRDYFQVVRMWTKVDNDKAVFEADAAFRRMRVLYYRGNESMKPSVDAFRVVIEHWKRSRHGGKEESIRNLQAEMVFLHGKKSIHPPDHSY